MIQFTSPRWRWAVPAAGSVVIGGVVAGTLIGTTSAAPVLAPRTPAQFLADLSASDPPARLRRIVGANGISRAMPGHIVDAIAGAILP